MGILKYHLGDFLDKLGAYQQDPNHAWKKWATWRPDRRETGNVSGKFEGKNEEEKGKEEGKIGT